MWHRYTENLQEAFLCAAGRAAAMGERDISSGALLQALASKPEGQTEQILARLGIEWAALETGLAQTAVCEAGDDGSQPALTPPAREAVERAYRLAAETGDSYIGGEHILLAFVQEPAQSAAGTALAQAGLTWEKAWQGLMAQQRWRTHLPQGVSFPGLQARRLKARNRGAVGRIKRLGFALANLNQPFLPYFLFPKRTKDNPYPFYARLRRRPVYWDLLIDHWVVTGYEEVAAALAEPRFSHRTYAEPLWRNEELPPIIRRECRRLDSAMDRQMLFRDAPEQARQRSLVARKFTPAVIARMQEEIQRATDELLDAAAKKGCMEVIGDFGVPLPMSVIIRMLGVPESDMAKLKRWSDSYIRYIAGETSLSQELAAYRDVQELTVYFQRLIPERRREPKDDLLSLFLQADEDGNKLTDEEVVANCLLLLAGGHENTTRLIGNGLLALLRDPSQFQWLREDLSRMPAAVEELLRYDSPVQWTVRIASEDFTWRGHDFKKDQMLLLSLAAANRDTAHFPDADKLDLARAQNRHLAFGSGPHFCLGAALTRMEGQIALGSLISRFPNLQLDGRPERPLAAITFRGLQSLPVRLV